MTPPHRKPSSASHGHSKARLAVDIGGTFTDVVLAATDGRQFTTKLLTTHDEPAEAVLTGISAVLTPADMVPADIGLIIHGTTLATNALIERSGACTALLTTAGHRDALEMAHEDRFEQYDINIDRPVPLVPRHLRLPVGERMDRAGRVLIPLDEDAIQAHLPVLDSAGVQSVAIGYLHAYVNPDHEQRTAEILTRARPDLSITLASEVAPEIREFERLSTACANAYVRPLMSRYLEALSRQLKQRGFDCPFLLITSGGGLTTLDTATRFPIRLVESGPAGGAILAQRMAEAMDIDRMLSFDMGGTTAKLCLIDDKKPLMSRSFEVDRVYRFKKGSGLPIRIPVIEMVEIGAGGGSIASIDKLGRIKVGPASAGSEPGPAAYGRGGQDATVTDADVTLGRVVADRFAFELDIPNATAALDRVATGLKATPAVTAFGISEVVDENMAAAARAHAAEFGMDLSARDIVAFGGAAPLHAARLGQKLGAKRVIIPANAGVGSAVGFLLAPVSYEVIRSRPQNLKEIDQRLIASLYNDMSEEALPVVRQATDATDLDYRREAYLRFVGQGHELAIAFPGDELHKDPGGALRSRFEAAYRRLYGHVIEGIDIEVLSWTLTIAEPAIHNLPQHEETVDEAQPVTTQLLFDPATEQFVTATIHERAALKIGAVVTGPALISEAQTTTVVPMNFIAEVNSFGCIIIRESTDD